MSAPHGVHVRQERSADEAAIRRLNDAAFGQSDESRIVDAMRAAGAATISLVAISGTDVAGHILFSPITIESPGAQPAALGLGPMAVAPEMQRRGIGSMLVEAGLQECRRLEYGAVVVVGHPEFYPRFGFRPGSAFGLRCEFDVRDEVFMVLELTPGVLHGERALVRYRPEFGAA